jgi:hypothetical protein
MSLDSLITITITKETKTPTQRGFGTAMLAAYHTAWPDRVREYSEPSEMLTDGFTVNSGVYKRAVKLKSQSPTVTSFKVGRRASAPVRTLQLTPKVTTQGHVYTFTVVTPAGVTSVISYTVLAAATVASICTAVAALVTALTGIDSTATATYFTVVTTTAGDSFELYDLKTSDFDVVDATADPGIVADLAAIAAEDSDWYGFTVDSHAEIELKLAAAWAEAQRIVFFCSTVDTGCLDAGVTTDVISDMKAAGYARTHIQWDGAYGTGAPESALAILLANLPGSVSLAYKSLPGVTQTTLSTAQFNAIRDKNGNTYTNMTVNGSLFEGISPAGEYIDIAILVDWTHARIQERTVGALQNAKKIPYTQPGAGTFKGIILGVLQEGVLSGGYAADPQPTASVPNVLDVPTTTRSARHLPGVTFSARLAGAIHTLDIRGTVSA